MTQRAFNLEELQIFRDGDCFCVVLRDFVNLQVSPAHFIEIDSWRGRLLAPWVAGVERGHFCNPLRHLPAIEQLSIWRDLTTIRYRGGVYFT